MEGKVTLDGKPLAGATVAFVPGSNGGQKATGTTEKDGTFKLTTGGKEAALPGEYKIVITKEVAGKSFLPARYGSENTTDIKVALKEGQNCLTIQLRSK
jgi:hypothetical protein